VPHNDKSQVEVIAEVGVNHNGSLDLARELIQKSRDAGADTVKFQTFFPEKLVSPGAALAPYQKRYRGAAKDQLSLLKQLMLDKTDLLGLYEHTQALGLEFLSTPFDLESVEVLASIGLDRVKISSGNLTDTPLLRAVVKKFRKIILSTGMSNLSDIAKAVQTINPPHKPEVEITILHCTSTYPATLGDLNLRALTTIKSHFPEYELGYSDHSIGPHTAPLAVSLGATVIEKHITLDPSMDGPDHAASIDPVGFGTMVSLIRDASTALGSNEKEMQASEVNIANVARKSIIATKKIRKGDTFSAVNLDTMRPLKGICAARWDDLIGRRSKRDYEFGERISKVELDV